MDTGCDDRLALKHAALEAGMDGLQEEVEQVAARLEKAKEAKKSLRAEVSFLQKRLKLLKESSATDNRIGNSFLNDESVRRSGERSKVTECPQKPVFVRESVRKAISQPSARHSSKRQEIVGVLKPSSSKHGLNGFPPNKSRGKRKISWQDEGFVKV